MLVERASVYEHSHNFYDGYINRNIRLCMAIIEASKPYIEVTKIE